MVIRGASSASPMTSATPSAKPAARWQSAVVTGIVQQTPTIKSFFFDLERPMPFIAGQHVDVRLTAPDGYRAMRSYSIASSPKTVDTIELAIELLQTGEVSPFFHDTVLVGDTIDIRGPLGGHFIWSVDDGGPLLLAGGGSGLVPLMSMLRYRLDFEAHVPTILVLSARTWDDVLFRDELLEMERRNDGFTLILTLTREAPRRAGDFGRRVDMMLMSDATRRLPVAPRFVFVCGANLFVNAVADGAIAAGIDPTTIRTERYGI